MDFLGNIFTQKYFVYWVEFLVILGIVIFILYISYSLNLFKRD